jgi:1,4-dihydroxy-6-naphthoate synthase
MSKLHFNIGFSPCPNDTYIFDALVHSKIESPFTFTAHLHDVQELNQMAAKALLPVTKLSFFAYASVSHLYEILDAGSALGNGCGPLLIAKNSTLPNPLQAKICVPGMHTTANLLLSIFYPELIDKTGLLFSEIESALLNEKFDAGVIIHENRFTYSQLGLKLIADLGSKWESKTQMPIPLGCIAVARALPLAVKQQISQLIVNSITYANNHVNDVMPYVKKHAQNMNEKVMKQHIDLYVNKYSLDLGLQGKAAINTLFAEAKTCGLINELKNPIFIN